VRRFILQAIDPDYGCPILEAMLHVQDLDKLRTVLGPATDGDLNLERIYYLDPDDLVAINNCFDLAFDPEGRDVCLWPSDSIQQSPYLVHTGYELFLLIAGTKKLAVMSEVFPCDRHPHEDLFDRYVADGRLHKEVYVEPFDPPEGESNTSLIEGLRQVFYTPKGEEWRIPAWQLIHQAARFERWNDTLERLEGMLFGYEPEQMSWWLNHRRESGAWASARVYCPVTAAELARIEAAGYRALPKLDVDSVALTILPERPGDARIAQFFNRPDSAALICVDVNIRFIIELAQSQGVDCRNSLDCDLPVVRVPDFNRAIVDKIVLVARR
jgi:hypothetical protein